MVLISGWRSLGEISYNVLQVKRLIIYISKMFLIYFLISLLVLILSHLLFNLEMPLVLRVANYHVTNIGIIMMLSSKFNLSRHCFISIPFIIPVNHYSICLAFIACYILPIDCHLPVSTIY